MNSSDATPATLLGLLSSIPANRTAIIHADRNIRVTYGALRDQVEAVAAALAAAGVGRGDRVGIALPNGLPAIVAFLVPVSLQMHRFWEVEDEQQRMHEMINFAKNMALVGAALMMMQLEEPWPISVDRARRRRADDMYVRLGGRDLRSLPA